MIPEADVKAEARRLGVDAMRVDLDHALGVVLWALTHSDVAEQGWIFKGGTSLRKSYFQDYRFSEDLDFTIHGELSPDAATALLAAAGGRARRLGVQLLAEQTRVQVPPEEGEPQSFELRVPFRGSLQRTGSPQVIQFHLTTDEVMLFPLRRRSLLHPYADAADVQCEPRVYALEETLAEKLRALCGQRRFAMARDLYDVWQLTKRGADVRAASAAVPEKARYKGLKLHGVLDLFDRRRAELRASWDRSLIELAPQATPEDFEKAWDAARQLVAEIDAGN